MITIQGVPVVDSSPSDVARAGAAGEEGLIVVDSIHFSFVMQAGGSCGSPALGFCGGV